jgi:hypothetical protein
MVEQACNSSTWKDCQLQTSLGYTVRLYVKKNKNTQKNVETSQVPLRHRVWKNILREGELAQSLVKPHVRT